MLKNKWLLLVILFLPAVAFCADAVAGVNSATGFVQNHLMAIASMVAVILEALAHVIPSEKPLGWFRVADALCKALSKMFAAMGDFLDKIIPQKSLPSDPPQPPSKE